MRKKITAEAIRRYGEYLIQEERSMLTVEKYIRDVRKLYEFLPAAKRFDKQDVMRFKEILIRDYQVSSVNSILAAVNGFFRFMGWDALRVKQLKVQKQLFRPQEQELSASEYKQLLQAAKDSGRDQIYLIMLTLCSTGIRVSELEYITAEAIKAGKAVVCCKNKTRTVLIPHRVCTILSGYAAKKSITGGKIFVTRNGTPVDRSRIWSEMKKLSSQAGIAPKKVYPHNLRHLFARVYYTQEKDIVKLADILGHSSIETARIYTLSTGKEHARQINRMRLII